MSPIRPPTCVSPETGPVAALSVIVGSGSKACAESPPAMSKHLDIATPISPPTLTLPQTDASELLALIWE